MSSPTSRPPVDPSDWAPRAIRERAAMERVSAANSEPLGEPQAPDPAYERLAVARAAFAHDLLAPSQPPGQTPIPGAAPAPSDAAAPAVASGGQKDKDVDVARLEDSLRWLQRQDASLRLPRVAPLPLVPGLTPPETPRLSREEIGRRRTKSLEPEVMPPPPAPRRRYLRASLALLTTGLGVAALGYYLGRTDWWPPASRSESAQVSTSSPARALASAAPLAAQESVATIGRDADSETPRTSEASERARGIAQLAKLSEQSATAVMPAGEPISEAPAAAKTARALGPDEIKLLLQRGEQFAGAGDLASARVVLQRAAQAGDATAALAMGATYDPLVLAKIGAVGFAADIDEARSWYQKAVGLGSGEATQRLQALGNGTGRSPD